MAENLNALIAYSVYAVVNMTSKLISFNFVRDRIRFRAAIECQEKQFPENVILPLPLLPQYFGIMLTTSTPLNKILQKNLEVFPGFKFIVYDYRFQHRVIIPTFKRK